MFTKVLIANRGEIAVRVMRACKELGIATVAVYSEADKAALHVRYADEAHHIGPSAASESYLRIERIIEVARESGAQAIHPGYGFLSENAAFARACADAGIVFIGPPPEAIELMGSKIAAKQIAEKAGAPTVPGYNGDDQSTERLLAEAERIGFPLLIKASAGGGGKGMRSVTSLDDFTSALEGARREARSAFGDDSVLLERLVLRPRHIEIQVLADHHGNIIHLGERECSIQRRHQKIVEEAPSVALSPELRDLMGQAAVRVAAAAGYRNAGTIEFIVDQEGRPSFLEMNTRLQVEHPVTEQVTGLDLVHLQLLVASGEPLPITQEQIEARGHAIEVRLYAEDPTTFLPAIGRLALFEPPTGPGVRVDAGLETGDEVTVNYDPMIAKLIVSAPSRQQAVGRLRRALDELSVLGLTTNQPLLQAIAAHPAFLAGDTTTAFLAEHAVAPAHEERLPDAVLAAAAWAMLEGRDKLTPDPWTMGQWQPGSQGLLLRLSHGANEHQLRAARRGEGWALTAGEVSWPLVLVARRGSQVVLRHGAEIISAHVVRRDGELLVGYRGRAYRLMAQGALDIDEWGLTHTGHGGDGALKAPMPGTVIKVLVEEGQEVQNGQQLMVLEAMKMEHTLTAPFAGTVKRLHYAAGQLVPGEALLIEIEEAA